MSIKNFLMRKMLKKQMSGIPETEQEKIFSAIENNPEFFTKIASEVKDKMSAGKDQTTATMEVMKVYEDEMKKLIS